MPQALQQLVTPADVALRAILAHGSTVPDTFIDYLCANANTDANFETILDVLRNRSLTAGAAQRLWDSLTNSADADRRRGALDNAYGHVVDAQLRNGLPIEEVAKSVWTRQRMRSLRSYIYSFTFACKENPRLGELLQELVRDAAWPDLRVLAEGVPQEAIPFVLARMDEVPTDGYDPQVTAACRHIAGPLPLYVLAHGSRALAEMKSDRLVQLILESWKIHAKCAREMADLAATRYVIPFLRGEIRGGSASAHALRLLNGVGMFWSADTAAAVSQAAHTTTVRGKRTEAICAAANEFAAQAAQDAHLATDIGLGEGVVTLAAVPTWGAQAAADWLVSRIGSDADWGAVLSASRVFKTDMHLAELASVLREVAVNT